MKKIKNPEEEKERLSRLRKFMWKLTIPMTVAYVIMVIITTENTTEFLALISIFVPLYLVPAAITEYKVCKKIQQLDKNIKSNKLTNTEQAEVK